MVKWQFLTFKDLTRFGSVIGINFSWQLNFPGASIKFQEISRSCRHPVITTGLQCYPKNDLNHRPYNRGRQSLTCGPNPARELRRSGCGGSSVLTLNPARVLLPNPPKDERLYFFSHRAGFSYILLVLLTSWCWLTLLHLMRSVTSPVTQKHFWRSS